MSVTYISAALRREVINRANNCCEYCLLSQEDIFFTFAIDHIISEKHGGATESSNLCLACPDCNAFKGTDIASIDWDHNQAVSTFYDPRKHDWQNHFQLDMQTGQIFGLTAIGRVTVFLFRINDSERVTDRLLYIRANRYPCQPTGEE